MPLAFALASTFCGGSLTTGSGSLMRTARKQPLLCSEGFSVKKESVSFGPSAWLGELNGDGLSLKLDFFGSPSCSDPALACSRALLTTSSFSSGYDEQVEYTTAKTLGNFKA